jgi:ABC-type Fe3+-siderophore transport system permease subunit
MDRHFTAFFAGTALLVAGLVMVAISRPSDGPNYLSGLAISAVGFLIVALALVVPVKANDIPMDVNCRPASSPPAI